MTPAIKELAKKAQDEQDRLIKIRIEALEKLQMKMDLSEKCLIQGQSQIQQPNISRKIAKGCCGFSHPHFLNNR